MKLLQASLCPSKDVEGSFHLCVGPIMLLQGCLNVRKVRKGCFNRRADAMKYVQACLSARKDRENSFHHCGGPVKLVQACLCAVKT